MEQEQRQTQRQTQRQKQEQRQTQRQKQEQKQEQGQKTRTRTKPMAAMAAQAPQLTVTVSHATGLRTTQMFGKQDPYVEVRCLETGEMRKTQTCEDGSKNPTWTQLAGCCVFRKTCPTNLRNYVTLFVMNKNKGTDSRLAHVSLISIA